MSIPDTIAAYLYISVQLVAMSIVACDDPVTSCATHHIGCLKLSVGKGVQIRSFVWNHVSLMDILNNPRGYVKYENINSAVDPHYGERVYCRST